LKTTAVGSTARGKKATIRHDTYKARNPPLRRSRSGISAQKGFESTREGGQERSLNFGKEKANWGTRR